MEPKSPQSSRRSGSVFKVRRPERYTLQRQWFQSVEALLVQRDVFEWIADMVTRSLATKSHPSPSLSQSVHKLRNAAMACLAIAQSAGEASDSQEREVELAFCALADGDILCEAMNGVDPSLIAIHKVQVVEEGPSGRRAFMRRDNIGRFLSSCQRLGIPSSHLFDPSSLIQLAVQSGISATAQHVNRKQVLATLLSFMDQAKNRFGRKVEEGGTLEEEVEEDSETSSSSSEEESEEETPSGTSTSMLEQVRALEEKVEALQREVGEERGRRSKAYEMLKAALDENSRLAKENRDLVRKLDIALSRRS